MAVMTLATFLVVFTLMMARLTAGVDPALRASANPVSLTAESGTGTVTTRVSGAGAASGGVTQSAAAHSTSAPTAAIVTRTSGVAGARGAGDD